MTFVVAAALALLCALVVFDDQRRRFRRAVRDACDLAVRQTLDKVIISGQRATLDHPPPQFLGMDVIAVPKHHLPPGVDAILFDRDAARHLPWDIPAYDDEPGLPWDSMHDPTDPDYPFKETP